MATIHLTIKSVGLHRAAFDTEDRVQAGKAADVLMRVLAEQKGGRR